MVDRIEGIDMVDDYFFQDFKKVKMFDIWCMRQGGLPMVNTQLRLYIQLYEIWIRNTNSVTLSLRRCLQLEDFYWLKMIAVQGSIYTAIIIISETSILQQQYIHIRTLYFHI